MGLPAAAGNTILASDFYQLCQPSGNQETGKYYLNGWGSASGDFLSTWVPSMSRNATPVSVSIDTSTDISTNLNSPGTAHLSSSGFQVNATTKAASVNEHCGGNYTISF